MTPRVRLLLLLLLVSPTVFAQDEPSSPTPSPTPSPIQWSLGIGGFSSPRPYVGAENSNIVAPLVEISWKKIYVQGIQAGYRFFDTGRYSLDARAGIVFNGLEPEDSPDLEGMKPRRSSIEGGVVFNWKPGKYVLSTALYTDLLGRSYGQEASTDFSRTWTFNRYRWGFTPSVGAVWQSSNFVDYYYGVTPEEVRPDRPPYQGGSVINFRSSLFGFFFINMRIRLVGLIRIQRLDNGIYNSPIVDRKRGVFALFGLTYRFGVLPPRPS